MSAAKAFLRPAMKRPNLTVRTHAHVTRILFDGVTAAGVEYAGKGFCYKVRAEKEVILCGGVINSPQLLQLSGIGARDVLEPLGIRNRSEEHTSELQSLMRISYAVFCLKKKTQKK